jgi:hypothetical protein
MKDVIWLRVDRNKVLTMTKGQPQLGRGDLAVKVSVEVDPSCWGSPVLEQSIHIADWRQGMQFPDVQLTELVITEAEAERIRREREQTMAAELARLGWEVTPPEPAIDDEGDPDD